jgi:hypothetical protein
MHPFWYRCLRLALLLAALTAVLPRPARAAVTVTCQDLRDLGLIVSLTDRDVTGGDETEFCLVARPEEDTFTAFFPNVTTSDQFRAVKLRYVQALLAAGYDICRIGVWRPVNRAGEPQPVLSAADRLDVPIYCPPRVVARDPGAAAWVDRVSAAVQSLAERTAQDFGVLPRRPLTLDLYTDPAAVAGALLAARPELESDTAVRLANEGRSLTVLSPVRGMFVVLNLTDAPPQEALLRRLAHEYTHFAQAAVVGTLDALPLWFLEGQAEFQMERLAGSDWDRLADAARRERAGTAPRLTELVTGDQWASAEALYGNTVYSRAYSAILYLTQRWGYSAPVKLLRAASDTDPARFDRALTDLTGMDLAAFDQALSDWLRTLGGRLIFFNDSPLSQRLFLADGRTVDVPACPTCTFHREGDSCRTEGRPVAVVDVDAGEVRLLRVVPWDRVHFPDLEIVIAVDPGTSVVRCLDLRA